MCDTIRFAGEEKRNIYEKAKETFQNWTNRFFILLPVAGGTIFSFSYYIQSFYLYFTKERSNDVFTLCLPGSYPFEWKTPIHYSLVTIFQAISVYNGAAMMFILPCFFIGFCFYTETFLFDIETNLNDLNDQIIADHPHGTYTKRERNDVMMKFLAIIQFHVEIKQLSETFLWCFISVTVYHVCHIFELTGLFRDLLRCSKCCRLLFLSYYQWSFVGLCYNWIWYTLYL